MKRYQQIVIGIAVVIFIFLIFLTNYSNVQYLTMEKGISPEPTQMKINVRLYFINKSGMLQAENRNVTINNNQLVEGILDALKAGPKNKKLLSPMDENTKLLSYSMDSKECYLNFNEAFIESSIWTTQNKNLIVWAIVNTLTEMEQIEKVQILIDGKSLNSVTNAVRFYGPIIRNDSLVYEQEKPPSEVVINFLNSIAIERYDIAYDLIDFESHNSIPYYDFHKMMALQSKKYKNYERKIYFTQKFSNSLMVYIKYEALKPNDMGVYETFGEYWEIVEEDGEYKVLFKEETLE